MVYIFIYVSIGPKKSVDSYEGPKISILEC